MLTKKICLAGRFINSSVFTIILLTIFLSSCNVVSFDDLYNQWKKGSKGVEVKGVYPADKAIFPPEIAAPTILWEKPDAPCDLWYVSVEVGGKKIACSDLLKEEKWRPSQSDWEKIKQESKEKNAKIIILGTSSKSSDKLLASASVNFKTSKDPVGAPIFFRTVTLPFQFAVENLETISWRIGNISSTHFADTVLQTIQVCANCHSFSSDGKVIGMDVDYANDKGSYFISDISSEVNMTIDKIISWSDYRREDGRKTYGLLSSVSPDGNYVISTVKDRSIFVPINDAFYSQLFFPIKGILAVYDKKNKRYFSLPGADFQEFVQSNPSWSPDGKYIYFTRTTAYTSLEAEKSNKAVLPVSVAKEFIDGSRRFFYDIYKIPFNDGKGGKAELVPGASGNDMSNYFPKISPDGKWMVFCQAKNFMLLQPDSKLYIMPASGGTPRLMNCNTDKMNSWHSWSPNGKWLVFSSKARGTYTKLYLTHIDENGNDSPPVCLEYMSEDNLAVNIPEFVNLKPDAKLRFKEQFMNSDYYAEARVNEKAKSGDFKGAIEDLGKAIKLRPDNYFLYYDRAIMLKKLGKNKAALEDLNKAIQINSKYPNSYYERAFIKIEGEDFKGAIADLETSIGLAPGNYMAMYELAYAKFSLKNYQESIEDCNKLIKMKSDFGLAYYQRALNNIQLNNMNNVCDDLQKAMSLGCHEANQVWQDYCR